MRGRQSQKSLRNVFLAKPFPMFAIEGVEKDAMTHVTNPEDKYITTIKEVVLAGLADEDVSIALFGSTVNKQKRQSSDVDIAIVPRNGWNQKKWRCCEKSSRI